MRDYLTVQDYVEPKAATFEHAARIWFGLRRGGLTVRSVIDCCIAQSAMENGLLLLHRDRDFAAIAQMLPLRQEFLHWPDAA